jgi:hypothetical protein
MPYQPRSTGHGTAYPASWDARQTADDYAARLAADRVAVSVVVQRLDAAPEVEQPRDGIGRQREALREMLPHLLCHGRVVFGCHRSPFEERAAGRSESRHA